MAHVGQEVALRPACRFGRLLGLQQLGLGALAVGDVDDGAEQAGQGAIAAGQRHLAVDRVVTHAAAWMDNRLVSLHAPRRQQFGILGRMQRSLLGAQQIMNGLAEHLLARCLDEQFEGPVQAQVTAIAILQVERQRDGLDQLLDQVQLILQLHLGLFAVGDVGADRDVLFRQAIRPE